MKLEQIYEKCDDINVLCIAHIYTKREDYKKDLDDCTFNGELSFPLGVFPPLLKISVNNTIRTMMQTEVKEFTVSHDGSHVNFLIDGSVEI